MIKILHFYPADEKLISQYVEMLCTAMQDNADVKAEHSLHAFYKTFRQWHPDIVHLHGCWRTQTALAAKRAGKGGVRIVFSPHGGLEPWVIRQHFWREKLPKLVTFQRSVVKHSYAVITMGRMEESCLKKLDLNPRLETVKNAIVTETITARQMSGEVLAVYRKVLDSDPYGRMDDTPRMAVRALLKAGLTGDSHWLDNEEFESVHDLSEEDWRLILLYAHQEQVADTVARGILVTGVQPPTDFQPSSAVWYQPPHSAKRTAALDITGKDDTAKVVKALRSARKLARQHRLTVMHLTQLAELMRNNRADEEKVERRLDEHKLLKFSRRLMKVLEDLTGLEEGFMVVAPLYDRTGYNIEQNITKHFKIL